MSTRTPDQGTQGTQRPTRQIRVQRTYLIQRIQEWVVDIPADYDTEEWQANDAGGFDQYVCDNGDLVSEDYDHVEYDDLELKVLTHTECGPDATSWFAPHVWPRCACGYAPQDNDALSDHWRERGFEVVDDHGNLTRKPLR